MKRVFLTILFLFSFSLCSVHAELSLIEQMDRDIIINSETIANGNAARMCENYIYIVKKEIIKNIATGDLHDEWLKYTVYLDSKIKQLPYVQQKLFKEVIPAFYIISYLNIAHYYWQANDYNNASYYSGKFFEYFPSIIYEVKGTKAAIAYLYFIHTYSTVFNHDIESIANLGYINNALKYADELPVKPEDISDFKAMLYFLRSGYYSNIGLEKDALDDLNSAEQHASLKLRNIIQNFKAEYF